MGTRYSSQAISGYNSSAPSDDGSTANSNKVKWATIKSKLADPVKTQAAAIDSALVTALNMSARAVSADDIAADTDHDKTIQCNTSSITITLSDATTMAAGYTVSVHNNSTGNVSVALATSTDLIDTVTNATNTIYPHETRRYIVNAAANGYVSASSHAVGASDTVPGKIEVAVQSEMETGTSTTLAVTPGRQHYHASAAKAWIIAPQGFASVAASYNVTSLTDNGLGDATVNMTTGFSSTNYAVVMGMGPQPSVENVATKNWYTRNSASTIGIRCQDTDANLNIDFEVSVAALGDL